jgi:hypothetical protein
MSEKLVCVGGERWGSCGIVLHWENDNGFGEWGRDHAVAIRCLDCGSLMCPRCAREHFKSDEKDRRIDALEKALRGTLSPLINVADILDVVGKSELHLEETRLLSKEWELKCRAAHADALALVQAGITIDGQWSALTPKESR